MSSLSLSLSGPRKIRTQNKQTIIRRKKRVRILSLSLSGFVSVSVLFRSKRSLLKKKKMILFKSSLEFIFFPPPSLETM